MFALLLTQATPYPGGDFLYVAGRCLEMVPPDGPVHVGLEKSDCAELSKLNAQLNQTFKVKMKSLSAKDQISLRDAERAWLVKLNDTCRIGNDAQIMDEATSSCFATEVRKRIDQLR